MNNPPSDNQKLQTEKVERNSSPLPHERLALKYNPHPRQERLQSMSSTDGSECSTQSKVNDPRIKLKLPTNNTLDSPTQVANVNVNVLPAINLNDPRLKRQNTVALLTTPTGRKPLLSTPPTATSTPIMGYPNTNPLSYSYRKDPRISRIPNQPLSTSQTPPARRDSINQPQYSSEENWDSDEEDISLPNRQLKRDQEPRVENKFENSKNVISNHQKPNRKNNMSHTRFPLNSGPEKFATTEPEENWSTNTEKEASRTYVHDRNKPNLLNKETITPTNTLNAPKKTKKQLKDARNAFVLPAPPPKSGSEEDWDSEPETANVKLNVEPGSPKISAIEKPPVSPVVSPFPNHIAPKTFANPMLQIPATLPPIIMPPNPYNLAPYPIIGPQNHTFPIQSSAPSNRFSSVLNDKSERIKYFEAKKQKSHEPRTYKEFREARERAQAQEAALKRAAEEEEAKKRAATHEKVTTATDTKEPQKEAQPQIVDETKKDKKPYQMETNKSMTQPQKDHKKAPAPGESSLDKMYRTQNFNSKFPKTNTSFRIPKKKTEEKLPEETATKTNEECKKASENTNKDMPADNIKETNVKSPIEISVENQSPKDKDDNIKCTNNKNQTEPSVLKHLATINNNDKQEEKLENPNNSEENKKMLKVASSHKEQAVNENRTEDEDKSAKTTTKDIETKQNIPDQVNNKEIPIEDNKKNNRDPRCRSKDPTKATEDEKISENEAQEENFKMFGDIVITSSEKEVTLKPQQNLTALDKFNKLTEEFAPKPQRILRRRNTMVVFDSAPLVDKEKLRKANALLFEDVQEEEKRKRKQLEEERLNARRNKNLEEMFKKTDDNCTVSTQNIITGKRRTRATINFNETVNAINVFKHKTMKDLNTTPPAQATNHPVKSTRSNAKLKMKNVEALDTKDDDKSDDDNTETAANKDLNKSNKETKAVKTKSLKDENKTEEIDKTKLNVKTTKKRNAPNKKSCNSSGTSKDPEMTASALTTNNEVGFIPIQDDENQNCAVSSTSTENSSEHQASSYTTTTNRSFKKETDDNEPTSTANKSNNSTPTPEANVQVLNEIVDQILKPNADREHILGLLGQILNEERLEIIKSLIESSNKQNQEQPLTTDETTHKKTVKQENNKSSNDVKEKEEDGDDFEEQTALKFNKATTGKKMSLTKRKQRSELDRLNEDIRDMFICKGVLTATGRRMCTIMGKEVETEANKSKPTKKEITPSHTNENAQSSKRKEEKLKPPVITRPLRRSLRVCKTNEDNEDDDNHSILSRTTEESIDELNTNTDTSTSTDATPQRKMPVLKPHTPIKIPEEVATKSSKGKELASKRKSVTKSAIKLKRLKTNKIDAKEDSESEEQASETEADEEEPQNIKNVIKNTNLNWHNQSKFTTWCLICEKRLQANSSSLHYKTHHGENYISRMAPVLLQQFKQGKLNQPLFGVKKAQKQPSWFYRCPFCLKCFNTPMPLWLEHFQNHTVEYRYECSKCHRCSNRKLTVSRHIKSCEGASIITSTVKLNVPTVINAHVCHLCNFIQLKRVNLERHYIEQHQLEKNTAELLGYTITLFDVENVECVTEDKAAERESEAWKTIEKNEQVIDIEDEDEEVLTRDDSTICQKDEGRRKETVECTEKEIETENSQKQAVVAKTSNQVLEKASEAAALNQKETEYQTKDKDTKSSLTETKNRQQVENFSTQIEKDETTPTKVTTLNKTLTNDEISQKTNSDSKTLQDINKSKQTEADNETCQEVVKKVTSKQDDGEINNSDSEQKQKDKMDIVPGLSESEIDTSKDFEVISEKETVQDIQNELLALAAEAAGKEDETEMPQDTSNIILVTQQTIITEKESTLSNEENEKDTTTETTNYKSLPQTQTTMSDIISSSIDMIYQRGGDSGKRKTVDTVSTESSEVKKLCPTASNVFMPTRDENYSPTIQILAQSIINIEEASKNDSPANKPITMAERLSQRFKDLKHQNTSGNTATILTNTSTKENAFQKLINDTVLELEKEKDTCLAEPSISSQPAENLFDELIKETVLGFEKEKDATELTAETPKSLKSNDIITVISDDEDWEDIEITETAPAVASTSAGNIQKSQNKGLFQKFGIFKGNNTKSKKHLSPMVFLPKKKTKEKPLTTVTTILSPSPTTTTTTTTTATTTKINTATIDALPNDSHAHLGFKPVVNIMDDLLPDSPCNDPIDLVPELAPLEPLQDLNDISSILDSNLSAVNINPADHHASIEDALDFVSEQQENDIQKPNCLATKSQAKTVINNISHVGYSVQTSGENKFKFYCLLQNCTFLYSSDSIGLETHFMYEHGHIKWNGYCLMCQAQCFPNAEVGEEHPITTEIRHMMDQHANKPQLDLHTDSTQHSTTSSQGSEERPKIKLRRMTGDCLSRSTPENVTSNSAAAVNESGQAPLSMLGALLVAKPKPPTKEMPPQPQMPLTEPLLLDNNLTAPAVAVTPFTNVNSEFLITSVSSTASTTKETPLQISSVISLNRPTTATTTPKEIHLPKILNVRTLAPKVGSLWSQQIEKDRQNLAEAAAESLEVSRILENAGKPSINREVPRATDDSPVIVAETVPLAQAKTGDFVVTQTVSAQYNEFSSAALGFNISIAATNPPTTANNAESAPLATTSATVTARQYKCMGSGCKFISRVPVAMSDHLRFHERRNFSNKRDYMACGFCFYCATDVEDYMKHADQFHIIHKQAATNPVSTTSEIDTAASLTQKIQNILNSNNSTSALARSSSNPTHLQNQATTQQVQDTQEVYLKKLRSTIDEIVGPTGLADDKLYRCVIKNCFTQLTESTFLSHMMFHITANGGNPNNYIFKCPHCAAQYHRPAGIKAHIKNHARNRYFCYLCEQTSTNPGQLLKHFSEKHWHTLNMCTKELLKPITSTDGSELVLDSGYYVAYTQDLSDEEVRKFGEKLILEWQRKKSGSKTHFKSSEIDLLPMTAIFQREVNCGECEYKTKVRTNMFRHLQMHKQNPGLSNKSGMSKVCSVDPVNPVPCLNSSERFFDKMTNLASSSLIPSTGNSPSTTKSNFKIPYGFVEESKRYTCGCLGCNYHTISEDLFRAHLSALHSSAMVYRCIFCQEEICKRGITIDRIINHLRFHSATIYRCEECNYVHYLRYVVERHINERHATAKVNIVTHDRSSEENAEGTTTATTFTGKKYKDSLENNQPAPPTATSITRSAISENLVTKTTSASGSTAAKGKGKWVCDVCGHRATTVGQMQTHCQQQHGVKNQYKCAHCNFGSQQLSQILAHIDDKHAGKTREARYMYHKSVNTGEEVADTRPLWLRNDPKRVRHIRGILMEDEEESEEYRKKLALSEDLDDDNIELEIVIDEQDEELNVTNYLSGYEFGCYHCVFKTQTFDELKNRHYPEVHNDQLETSKPFWYRLHRRLCCAECRSFIGNYIELQKHLLNEHKKTGFFAADITMAENDDPSQRILCGYCSFHCANAEHLHRHYLRMQHWPQDIRIDNNEQIMDILALGKAEVSYQCTLCGDIFSNRVAIVQHACSAHAGEDSFSFRELTNSLIYRCNTCCFTSTKEIDLLRHMIEHYSRFKICNFCRQHQSSFNVYMQHCYAEHRNEIQKFKAIYPLMEIRKYLLQMLIVFPSGLVLNKRNLLNTKYGKMDAIEELYEDIYKISQQPPIPRLSIARLVARKSIEAQQKQVDYSSSSPQEEILNAMQTRPKSIPKRRPTMATSFEETITSSTSLLKPKLATFEATTTAATITKRRTTVDHENVQQQQNLTEINAPLETGGRISKRRRTVAVDRDTLFSSNLTPSTTNNLLMEKETCSKKRKAYTYTNTPSPKHIKEMETYPLNLDLEPFSFYGQKPEPLDLTKIYTKVAIAGIKTPLTIDKFKLLFNIECQLKLIKCDDDAQTETYTNYKHIKKACPASHKLRFN